MTPRMAEYLRMRQHPYEGDDGTGPRLLHCPRPFCDKVLTSSAGLRYHIKAHDTTEGMYRCMRCTKHFKSYNGLRYHTQKSKCETNSSSEEENSSEESPQKTYVAECSWYTSPVENGLMFSELNCKAEQSGPSWSDTEADFERPSSSPKCEDDGNVQQDNWLRELAIIATGPQSPLLHPEIPAQPLTARRATWPSSVRPNLTLESSLHSYARPPPRSRTPSPPPSPVKADNRCMCNANSNKLCLGSHNITPVWLIFLRGTRLRFLSGEDLSWFDVEEWPHKLPLGQAELGQNGLRVTELREVTSCSNDDMVDIEEDLADNMIELTLTPVQTNSVHIQVQCPKHHPFFVKEKGWCSLAQEQTEQVYALTYCETLGVDDVCLPPNHPDAACTLEMLDSFRSHHFTAMDSSAVLALSNMAKKKELCLSPPRSVTVSTRKVSKKDQNKAKRPMNAFMLFAKRFRMEYMQLYPGKDNRAISVLLGDHWKKLTNEERRAYTQEAKLLADQQKRLHPDCWKRKRSVSTSVLER